jgi:multidrug resistance efflux pump
VQGFVQTISYADDDYVKKGTSLFTIEPEPYKCDSAQADLQSAQSNAQQTEINLGYTNVTAPFDGVVTARQVSIGQLSVQIRPPPFHHRPAQSDLGEFHCQRARRSAGA